MFSCKTCNKIFKRKENLNYHNINSVCTLNNKCIYCNKLYKTRTNLTKHIKKNHTDNILIQQNSSNNTQYNKINNTNYTENDIKNNTEHDIIKIDNMLTINKEDNSTEIQKNIIINSKKNICTFCNKTFTRKNNLTQHIKKWCKNKSVNYVSNINSISNINNCNNIQSLLTSQLSIQHNNIEQNIKNTYELLNKISNQLLNKCKTKIIINEDKSKININKNKLNYTKPINIKFNAYGNENLSHLNASDYLKCYSKGIDCLIEYIKLKHFDPEHPENNNLYLPNIQQPFYKIYDGNKFILQSIDKLINDVIGLNLLELDEIYEEIKSKSFNKDIQIYNKFIDLDGSQRDTILTYLIQELKLLLYNEKDMPMKALKYMNE